MDKRLYIGAQEAKKTTQAQQTRQACRADMVQLHIIGKLYIADYGQAKKQAVQTIGNT